MPIDWIALVVFVLLFVAITVLGFVAVHWRRGDLDLLHEWGLAGGRFGTVVTWFLLGGDLYTAYTFIAVPALMFGAGAIAFFAVPYTIMVYPFVFVVFPRLWSVARANGYITASDFVRGRHGSRWLALAVAVTGIVATMPYIALQLVGIQVVIAALGLEGSGWMADLPLVIAFVILAAFTYTSGLARAGGDRHRQGHADLDDRDRGGGHDPAPAWRLRQDLRRDPAGQAAAGAGAGQRAVAL
jgi:SSS family solute:Na+ symporter